jgi:hypothetical protein
MFVSVASPWADSSAQSIKISKRHIQDVERVTAPALSLIVKRKVASQKQKAS